MLTYRTGAAGAPSAALAMAEYLAKESHVAGLSDKLASYYGHGLMSDEGMTTSGIPLRTMDASIATLLGVDPSKPLTTMQMANILAGQRADGENIPGKKLQSENKIRIAYLDFTLSAPKSFSVALALAPTEAERAVLDKCHTDAVDSTLAIIAKTVGTVSKGDTRVNFERDKGHMAFFKFEHNTARPVETIASYENGIPVSTFHPVGGFAADMQRHTHCIAPAVAITDDGRVGSIHQNAIKQRVHEFGAIFQAHLAANARGHGVDVGLDNRVGLTFDERMAKVYAVPDRIVSLFSKRGNNGRLAAREYAATKGVDYDSLTPQGKADILDASIRENKNEKDKNATADIASWKAEAAAAGYAHRSVLRPGEGGKPHGWRERVRAGYDAALPLLETQWTKNAVIKGAMARVSAAKALIEVGTVDAEKDIAGITAAFRFEGVLQAGEKTKIRWAFDPAEHFARITTQLSADQEAEAIAILKAASEDKSTVLSPEAIQRAVDKVSAAKGLDFTEGHGLKQREVIDKLAASGRAAVAVGVAGSGKSSLVGVLVEAWHEDKRDVYGVTLGWRQTDALRDAGIGKRIKVVADKDTLIDAGISEQKTFAMMPFLKKLSEGELKLDRSSVVVIDEIALVGTVQMLDLARFQKDQGFQIVGIGDDKQNQAVDAGNTVDMARRAFGTDNVPELLSTIRQHRDRDQETSLMFRRGEAKDALLRKVEDNQIKIIAGGYEEAIKATVDLWFERRDANKDRSDYSLGVSVPTNADGLAIGEEIRRRRLASGEIDPTICHVEATDQNNVQYSLDLSIGDKVRLFNRVFGKDADNKTTFVGNNGSAVEVAGVAEHHLLVRVGDKIVSVDWEDLRMGGDRIRLARGHAVTFDARQSETLNDHIASMPSGSKAVNGFKAYVAESRHREQAWIVTSQGAEKMEIEQRRAIGDPRNEDTDPSNVHDSIIANMARNLSRQPEKTLATDFLERAVNLRSGSVDSMQAAWFRQETRQAEDKPPLATAVRMETKAEAAVPIAGITKAVTVAAPTDDWRASLPHAETPPPVTSAKPQETKPQMSPLEVQSGFADELKLRGFVLNGLPIMDGKWHNVRVDTGKKSNRAGGYIGTATGGSYNNKRSGDSGSWPPKGVALSGMSPEHRAEQQASDRAARLQAQSERNAREERVAGDAIAAWKDAKPAHPKHEYLVRKQIKPYGLRQGAAGQTVKMTDGKEMRIGGRLIVPLRDSDGKMWNIQIIDKDGGKLFLPGRKKGLSATIGPITPTGPVIIAEGFASAATLHNTTSLTSIAAIDSGNLLAVSASLRAKYPDMAIIFGADNDHHLPLRTPALPNVGIEKATEAAGQVGGVVVSPQFDPGDKGTDWNDVAVGKGNVAARSAIAAAFETKGIADLLPAPKQITQADRDAAWATAKPRMSRTSAPVHSVREVQKPTHNQGI